MASSALSIAAVAAKIDTAAQLRAAMGAVTTTLSQGYAKLDEIHASGGLLHDFTPFGYFADRSVDQVYQAAKSLLDVVNKSAGILYRIYPDDPDLQDEEISTWHAHSAGLVISEANDALKAVEDAAALDLFDVAAIVEQALALVGAAIGGGLQAVTNAVAAGGTAFVAAAWPTLLIAGLVIGAYVFRAPLLRALGKAVS